jgi:hypothetical protein
MGCASAQLPNTGSKSRPEDLIQGLVSSPHDLIVFPLRVMNHTTARTLVPADSEAGRASEGVRELKAAAHDIRPPAECGGCAVSTALAPVENGHECLDLSSYDPQAYNILSPVLRLDTAAPYLRFRAVEVRLDPDVHRGDCYAAPGTKWSKDRRTGDLLPVLVAPSKPGLLKIASAAGLVIDPRNSHRITPDACERCIEMAQATQQAARCGDCSSRFDTAYQYIGAVRTDTGWRIVKASYEWNLDAQRRKLVREGKKKLAKAQSAEGRSASGGEEGKPFDVEEYVDDRLDQITSERYGLAETKALLRLVRAICHLRQAYSREEMARPFIVVRTELAPDFADPAVRQALAQKAISSGAEIFGPEQDERPLLRVPPAEVIDELASVPDFADADVRAEEATDTVEAEPEAVTGGDAGTEPAMVPEELAAVAEAPVPESVPDLEPDQPSSAVGCDDCGTELTAAVTAYCQSPRGQATFGGANYCFTCQKKHRPVRKAVAQ